MFDFLLRESHVWFGILWIGLLYYFNFVQTEYFKEADPEARKDVVQKLVPRALWYFRWAAAFTFLTGLTIAYLQSHPMGGGAGALTGSILIGGLIGIFMAANVWFIIWPNQKIVIAGEGDTATAAAKAALASRTNTFFSFGMLTLMVASAHLGAGGLLTVGDAPSSINQGPFWLCLLSAVAVELNAVFGKMPKPLVSVQGVIISGLVYATFLYVVIGL